MISRKVETSLEDILNLVYCADDYGFDDEVLLASLAEITGPVSDEEIEEFAQTFLTAEAREKGFGEEDAITVRERLKVWRDTYRVTPI